MVGQCVQAWAGASDYIFAESVSVMGVAFGSLEANTHCHQAQEGRRQVFGLIRARRVEWSTSCWWIEKTVCKRSRYRYVWVEMRRPEGFIYISPATGPT